MCPATLSREKVLSERKMQRRLVEGGKVVPSQVERHLLLDCCREFQPAFQIWQIKCPDSIESNGKCAHAKLNYRESRIKALSRALYHSADFFSLTRTRTIFFALLRKCQKACLKETSEKRAFSFPARYSLLNKLINLVQK